MNVFVALLLLFSFFFTTLHAKTNYTVPPLFFSQFRINTSQDKEVGSIRNHQLGKLYFDILQGFRIDLMEENQIILSIFGSVSDKQLGDVTIYAKYFQSDNQETQCIVWTTLEHLFPFYLENKARDQVPFSIPERATLLQSFVNYLGIYSRQWQWEMKLQQFNPESKQTQILTVGAYQSLLTNMIVGLTIAPTPYGPLEIQLFDIDTFETRIELAVQEMLQVPIECKR